MWDVFFDLMILCRLSVVKEWFRVYEYCMNSSAKTMAIRPRYSRPIEICMLNVTGGVRGRAKDLFDDFLRQNGGCRPPQECFPIASIRLAHALNQL